MSTTPATEKTRKPFCRLDQSFDENPKVKKLLAIHPQAIAYYIAALAYATRHSADTNDDWPIGHIDEAQMLYTLRADQESITLLEQEGLLEPDQEGWTIHGFTQWQDTRDDIQAKREAIAERKRKSRATVTTTSHDSHSDTGVTDSDVTPQAQPVTPLRKKKEEGRNKKHSTNVECGETREDARPHDHHGQNQPQERTEGELIDLWEPTPACQALADELTAKGLPKVDIQALADRFRLKLHARGIAAYRLQPTIESLDYGFRSWIEPEARDPNGLHADTQATTATVHEETPAGPHVHDSACQHVAKILRTSTILASLAEHADRTTIAARLAERLNQGMNPGDAVRATAETITRDLQELPA